MNDYIRIKYSLMNITGVKLFERVNQPHSGDPNELMVYTSEWKTGIRYMFRADGSLENFMVIK